MSQKHSTPKLNLKSVVVFLRNMAHTNSSARGHVLSNKWFLAKKKIGKDAERTTCLACGSDVFILPKGQWGATGRFSTAPTMHGDAVFKDCAWKGKLNQTSADDQTTLI